ncbi:TPM domain-containing protein [Apibacter adventoris]|uniref:Methanol dehydrogenase n=1 Tax=Apibacter adventoris TaxID=1679466 RepID=A0A2S8AAA6_9FLAO|nr:TPM domain-containing protein [Apibacter adventoris]PQL91525.1 methanol dehydrogenase [Apibacter adventoris]PQL93573.1 methanol dehydrogenase [Apibacter adventoris]
MRFRVKNLFILCTFLFGFLSYAQTEFKIPERPKIIYPVNDYAGILTTQQKQEINQKLISYSDSTSTEIIVCTIKTLDGDDINYVGAKWGTQWGIGQKDKNNGILLLIAVNDHKLAIQNGKGTEDAMTDLYSGIIINQYMVPYLKNNDFFGAINSGTDQIIKVLQGKFKASPKTDDTDDGMSGFVVALILFFFILFIVLMKKKSTSSTYYDRNGKKKKKDDDDDFWGGFGGGFLGGGFGGFGRGSSSGGGFGGFGGGGSFGGGGASGSW